MSTAHPPELSLYDQAVTALANAGDFAMGLATPTLRLGVTGLSRAGKTVFITALVHNLVHGGRLPLFEPVARGRLAKAELEPQPDDAVPRFDVEDHVATLIEKRLWPSSTRRISELRLTLEFQSSSFFARAFGRGRLHLDIVDYPGEWLLDLPLLTKSYAEWSAETLARARHGAHAGLAAEWLAATAAVDRAAPEDETTARRLAALFTDYLRAARADEHALSTLPPGRFLMPGDLEGSPALTFAPLALGTGAPPSKSLAAMMERRYEAYKDVVVRPFFRDHFSRLDRQIVLVDALQALNAGPEAVSDLREALTGILACFRPGRTSWLASILTRRIDRIVFAATKADHLHRSSHDRLEKILRRLVDDAMARASLQGAAVDVVALAAVRATREAIVEHDGEKLPAILGRPLPGETLDGEPLDPDAEFALFPGDLPEDPDSLFEAPADSESEHEEAESDSKHEDRAGAVSDSRPTTSGHSRTRPAKTRVDPALAFVRFRPPRLERTAEGLTLSLPHIRLDRALQFLLGDRMS
ncbi:YcjX family protein [Pinisolibacter aquiterrae]|uniref:YcjX family protein n=1 Tax=Pinisolibacter aquiterrae TaxID=2815579 RepID=UPI001E48A2BB|nr:YcjX family protein [Pinisolibacter aquiterrae]MCC8235379.1 YcjX family protein [Pinisolibacter aquiterrae]